MQFVKAEKSQSRLRMAIAATSGSGKTYTMLKLLTEMAGTGGKVAVIDSERGSASKYADLFDFDVVNLETFSPDNYVNAIHAAEDAGYTHLGIDSLTHAWSGKDGALEQVDKVAARNRNGNGNAFAAWREVTPMHNALVDAMLGSKCHIVATIRSKTDYVQDQNAQGKTVIKKVGLAPIQRDGLEYEFDVMADMDIDHTLVIGKTRCVDLDGGVFKKPGKELADRLSAWLGTGKAIPVPVAPTPKPLTPREEFVTLLRQWSGLTDAKDIKARGDAIIAKCGITIDGKLTDEQAVLINARIRVWIDEKADCKEVADGQ